MQAGGQRFEPAYLHHPSAREINGSSDRALDFRRKPEMFFDNQITTGKAKKGLWNLFARDPARDFGAGKFYGQATKGIRWMPWRRKARKDVVSCEKPQGAANRL